LEEFNICSRKLSVLEQYLCESDLSFPIIVARIKTRVLDLLSRFRYLLILKDAVDSSISRVEIEVAISRLLEIQAAVDHPTAENVPRVPRIEKETHTKPGVLFPQLYPDPHFTGVSATKEGGCRNLGNHSGMSLEMGTAVSVFSHNALLADFPLAFQDLRTCQKEDLELI
jgi:hypothetical protein